MFRVKSPQDLGAGLTFIVIGIIGFYFGRDFTLGTAARMGPGYFPWLISFCLVVIGAVVGARSLVIESAPIAMPKARPLILILLVLLLFGALLERAGLAPTVAICTFLATFASSKSRLRESLLLSLGLSAFVTLIFVYLLGQQMTVFGS